MGIRFSGCFCGDSLMCMLDRLRDVLQDHDQTASWNEDANRVEADKCKIQISILHSFTAK